MRREDEMRVCRAHDRIMVLRPDGFHCEECKQLATVCGALIVACPRCNETLLVPHPEIDRLPSVGLMWGYADEFMFDGMHPLYVSAVRDSFKLISAPPITEGTVLRLACPYCKEELPLASDPACQLCGSGMVMVSEKYKGGRDDRGVRWICTKRGCPGHHLGEEGLSLDAQTVSMMARREFDIA